MYTGFCLLHDLLVDCEHSTSDLGLDKNGTVDVPETTGTRAEWSSIVIHTEGAVHASLIRK